MKASGPWVAAGEVEAEDNEEGVEGKGRQNVVCPPLSSFSKDGQNWEW